MFGSAATRTIRAAVRSPASALSQIKAAEVHFCSPRIRFSKSTLKVQSCCLRVQMRTFPKQKKSTNRLGLYIAGKAFTVCAYTILPQWQALLLKVHSPVVSANRPATLCKLHMPSALIEWARFVADPVFELLLLTRFYYPRWISKTHSYLCSFQEFTLEEWRDDFNTWKGKKDGGKGGKNSPTPALWSFEV